MQFIRYDNPQFPHMNHVNDVGVTYKTFGPISATVCMNCTKIVGLLGGDEPYAASQAGGDPERTHNPPMFGAYRRCQVR